MHLLAEIRHYAKFIGLVLIPTEDLPTGAPVLLICIYWQGYKLGVLV